MSEVLLTAVSLGRSPPSRGVCGGAGGGAGNHFEKSVEGWGDGLLKQSATHTSLTIQVRV